MATFITTIKFTQQGIKGRVRYYGCPAEEGGAAKAFMVRAGDFEDVDTRSRGTRRQSTASTTP